jgi:hypothetical protein
MHLKGEKMEQPKASLAQDLLRIHKVITRGLEVSLRSGRQYLEGGSQRAEELMGYSNYVHCLGAVLKAHHISEDIVIFPAARKVLPNAPYRQFSTDHRKIEALLIVLTQAIPGLAGDRAEESTKLVADTVNEISSIWYPHIQLEEANFTQATIDCMFVQDEQRRIGGEVGKISQEYGTPQNWVVPFVLFNLELEERKSMAASLPPAIMDELIPKVWKDEWSPMKPFLLD